MGRANRKNTASTQVRPLASVASSQFSQDEILRDGRQAEVDLASTSEPEQVRQIVAPLAAKYFQVISLMGPGGGITRPGQDLSLQLLDWLGDPSAKGLAELRQDIRKINNRLELREMLRDERKKIDYLEKLWGDKTREKISGLTQTRPQTVQKWLDGSNPSSTNSTALSFLVRIAYQLQQECGKSGQEARDWFEARHPQMGKRTVEDVLRSGRSYYWSLPREITEALRDEGADL